MKASDVVQKWLRIVRQELGVESKRRSLMAVVLELLCIQMQLRAELALSIIIDYSKIIISG